MSKKSTARAGSEGDAESTINDVFVNINSESSSCKSKREFEGGPFGDSPPCSNNQQLLKDYFILMFRDDDISEASQSSDADQELYNLQNDYLEKLNSVRRTLNLLEISEDLESLSPMSCNNRCTITEIEDEETDTNRTNTKPQEANASATSDQEGVTSDQEEMTIVADEENGKMQYVDPNTYDVIKIYPSTDSFNFDSTSTVNIFDLDYNPPKKKQCHRQKTPKLMSVSDGNLPYSTRIGLHDDLFNSGKNFEENKNLIWPDITKFIETKETQCTESDFKVLKAKSRAKRFVQGPPNDVNLYPKVVIEHITQNVSEPSSSSSQTSINAISYPTNTKLSLNVVEELSDDSYTTYSTTIESPKIKDRIKKRFGKRNRVSSTEKITLWEEIRKLHPPQNDDDDYDKITVENKEAGNAEDVKSKKEKNDYIGQYLRYKRQMESMKPESVPYGTTIAYKHTGFPGSLETFCVSQNSFMSNRGKKKKKKDKKTLNEDGDDDDKAESYLDKLCFCCR